MNRDILCRPFPPEAIRQRPGAHGKQVSYVDVAAVIARLNEGCEGGAWSFDILNHRVDAGEVIVLGRLTAEGISKTMFGGATISVDAAGRAISVADDLKAAASDALKKCASLFGVALEVFGGADTKAKASANQQGETTEPKDRITSRQLGALQALSRQLGLGRDALHGLLEERFRRSAPQFLTKAEASALLDELNQRSSAASR